MVLQSIRDARLIVQPAPHLPHVALEIAPHGLDAAAGVVVPDRWPLRLLTSFACPSWYSKRSTICAAPPFTRSHMARGAVQRVVLRGRALLGDERVGGLLPLVQVPGEHRLAGGVVEHPAIAGVHAVLEEQIAGDVVSGVRRPMSSFGLPPC